MCNLESNGYNEKMIQSEIGAVGEVSPNSRYVDSVGKELDATFEHEHGTITDRDAYIFLAQTCFGTTVNGEEACMALQAAVKGCEEDIEAILYRFLVGNPEYMRVFDSAYLKASNELIRMHLEQQEGGEDNGE